MRLKEFVELLQFRTKYDSQGANWDEIARKEINLAVKHHTNVEYGWMELRKSFTLSTVAAQSSYILPREVDKIFTLYHTEYSTRQVIPFVNPWRFYNASLSSTETALPTMALQVFTSPVLAQPTSASVIAGASSSANDTDSEVTIYGLVGGYEDFEILKMDTSDSTQSITTTKSFSRVDRISINQTDNEGRITLTSNSAAVTVGVIPVGKTSPELWFKQIELWPIPDAVYSLTYIALLRQFDLANDEDTPVLPTTHDDAILLRAQWNIERKKELLDAYKEVVAKLKNRQNENFPTDDEWTTEPSSIRRIGAVRMGDDYAYPFG